MKVNPTMTTTVRAQDLSGGSHRFVEELMRDIAPIIDSVSALEADLKDQQKVTAAILSWEIDQTQRRSSPGAPSPASTKVRLTPEDRTGLTKNYVIIQQLYETRTALEVAVAKLRSAFAEDSKSAQMALREITATQARVDKLLESAFAFLQDLARGHAPEALQSFVETVNTIMERSVTYSSVESYLYLFESDGALVFSNYMHMKNAVDDAGTPFPSLFVVSSMRAVNPPEFFINTLVDFEPPSDNLLLREVTSTSQLTRHLHTLLALDSFENNLGSIPVALLVSPKDLKKQMKNSAVYVRTFRVDEQTGQLIFILRATIKTQVEANEALIALRRELVPMVKATRSRLVQQMRQTSSGWVIIFSMVKPDDSPTATPDDLKFLSDRFGLNNSQVNRVLRVVNASCESRYQDRLTALKLPSGGDIPAETIVRAIDKAVADCRGNDDDYRDFLSLSLHNLGVSKTERNAVCDKALAEARYFRKGLDSYVREVLKYGVCATAEEIQSLIPRNCAAIAQSDLLAARPRTTEQARIKGADEYVWLKYTGKPLNLPWRGGYELLTQGDVIGVRMSSDGKKKRLIVKRLGPTYVFTLTPEIERPLSKNVVRVKGSAAPVKEKASDCPKTFDPVFNKKVEVMDADASTLNTLACGMRSVAFVTWREKNIGVMLVAATDEDRREFGRGVFRTGKGEMQYELIVKLGPKFTISFIDNDRYLEGEIVWQTPTPLTRCTIWQNEKFLASF